MPKVFLQFRLLTINRHDASDGMNDSPPATTAIIAVKLVTYNFYFPYFAIDNLKYNTEYPCSVSASSGQAGNTVDLWSEVAGFTSDWVNHLPSFNFSIHFTRLCRRKVGSALK